MPSSTVQSSTGIPGVGQVPRAARIYQGYDRCLAEQYKAVQV